MKAMVLQHDFRAAVELAWLGRAAKSTLPILGDIRLETRDGFVDVAGTDLETHVVVPCGAKVEIEGGVIANGIGLRTAIKGMKGAILLESTAVGLIVTDGHVSATLSTMPLSEGPNI